MNQSCLELTTFCAERDRLDGRLVVEALLDLYAAQGFQTSVLLRGIEGFGKRNRLQTQRILALSEDLPAVTVTVDTHERVQAVLPRVAELVADNLMVVERARSLTDRTGTERSPEDCAEDMKLTVYCGRQERERAGRRPAFAAVVDVLRRHDVAGAIVLLGVDGTAAGIRERPRFFSRNEEVPLMIISVAPSRTIAQALPELVAIVARPLCTVGPVLVCKRDGHCLAPPVHLPEIDEAGRRTWQKLSIYEFDAVGNGRGPLYIDLIRRLREADAHGGTTLRGIWGYYGDGAPHGDNLFALRRNVPVLTIIVDVPARIRRWWGIVDELTVDAGLVTSESVWVSATG